MEHCPRREGIALLLAGELEAAEREALIAHLRNCSECVEYVRRIRGLAQSIADLRPAVAPPCPSPPGELALAAFISHALSPAEAAGVEAHLAVCPSCCRTVATACRAIEEWRDTVGGDADSTGPDGGTGSWAARLRRAVSSPARVLATIASGLTYAAGFLALGYAVALASVVFLTRPMGAEGLCESPPLAAIESDWLRAGIVLAACPVAALGARAIALRLHGWATRPRGNDREAEE